MDVERVRIVNRYVRQFFGRTGTVKGRSNGWVEVQLDGENFSRIFWQDELVSVKSMDKVMVEV